MKKRIGTLYNKPIIEGDINLKTPNEIHKNELKGGENSGGGGLNGDSDYFIYIDGNKLTPIESFNIIEVFAIQFMTSIKLEGFPTPTFWCKMNMGNFDNIIPLEYAFEGSGFSEGTKKVYALPKKVPYPVSTILGSGFVYPEEIFGAVDIKEWMLQRIEYIEMPEDICQQIKFYIEEAFTIGQITKEEFLNS